MGSLCLQQYNTIQIQEICVFGVVRNIIIGKEIDMKRMVVVGLFFALSLMTANIALAIDVLKLNSGLNFIDEKGITQGYTTFYSPSFRGGTMVMIDNYGNLVHYWHTNNVNHTLITGPGPVPQFTADGHFIAACDNRVNKNNSVTSPVALGAGDNDSIVELDWNSNLVYSTGDSLYAVNYSAHHDYRKMWNKALGEYTYLALTMQAYGAADAVALGADPVYDTTNGYKSGWSPDGLVEMDQDHNIVWRWSFADHVVQNYDATKVGAFVDTFGYPNPGAVFGEATDFPGKLNINQLNDNKQGPCKDWNHCNSIDYNPTLGHVVINAKHWSELYVIDHDGTFVSTDDFEANRAAAQGTGGDFIYRFGNPHNYGQGTHGGYRDEGNHQIFGAHNIQWIGESAGSSYAGFSAFGELPGEGNMLIFDNSCWNPNGTASVVLEWNPFFDSTRTDTGDYVNPPEAGYQASGTLRGYSNQVVWKYEGGTGFYSNYISGAQRLPNGNTIVCSGAVSHYFEVTPSGSVVWEYFKPNSDAVGGATFRIHKFPLGHPILDGRDLTPKGNFRELVLEESAAGSSVTQAAFELKKYLGAL